MKANFKADLKRGKDAELLFLEKFPKLEKLSGYTGDFKLQNGQVLELKTDFYSPLKWPNVIMERFSYAEKPGGPWQAKDHGCSIFAYWFVNFDVLLLYPVDDLCSTLEKLIPEHKIKLEDKANKAHTTRFYRVDRKLLAHLLLSEEILK